MADSTSVWQEKEPFFLVKKGFVRHWADRRLWRAKIRTLLLRHQWKNENVLRIAHKENIRTFIYVISVVAWIDEKWGQWLSLHWSCSWNPGHSWLLIGCQIVANQCELKDFRVFLDRLWTFIDKDSFQKLMIITRLGFFSFFQSIFSFSIVSLLHSFKSIRVLLRLRLNMISWKNRGNITRTVWYISLNSIVKVLGTDSGAWNYHLEQQLTQDENSQSPFKLTFFWLPWLTTTLIGVGAWAWPFHCCNPSASPIWICRESKEFHTPWPVVSFIVVALTDTKVFFSSCSCSFRGGWHSESLFLSYFISCKW